MVIYLDRRQGRSVLIPGEKKPKPYVPPFEMRPGLGGMEDGQPNGAGGVKVRATG